MIDGHKVIAFTPAGRQRYMDILWRYVEHEHAAGHIDEWILFNNSYTPADIQHTQEFARRGSWIKVIEEPIPLPTVDVSAERAAILRTRPHLANQMFQTARRIPLRTSAHISTFYKHMTEADCVYVRLDDDLVHIDPNAVERLVRFKLANPKAFLVFPCIVNNTRMSYWLQREGMIPNDWGLLTNLFLEPTAWRDAKFAAQLHRMALPYAVRGRLSEAFSLPDRVLSNRALPDAPDRQYAEGHVSVNCFAISGEDMVACKVPPDEEGYLSDFRPKELDRHNVICGSASVIHFAYHPQTTEMEKTGLLAEYVALAESLGLAERWPLP